MSNSSDNHRCLARANEHAAQERLRSWWISPAFWPMHVDVPALSLWRHARHPGLYPKGSMQKCMKLQTDPKFHAAQSCRTCKVQHAPADVYLNCSSAISCSSWTQVSYCFLWKLLQLVQVSRFSSSPVFQKLGRVCFVAVHGTGRIVLDAESTIALLSLHEQMVPAHPMVRVPEQSKQVYFLERWLSFYCNDLQKPTHKLHLTSC